MKVTNIKWDVTDGAEEMTQAEIDDILSQLPTEVELPEDIAEDDYDEITDWLSDQYQFFVESFRVEDSENTEKCTDSATEGTLQQERVRLSRKNISGIIIVKKYTRSCPPTIFNRRSSDVSSVQFSIFPDPNDPLGNYIKEYIKDMYLDEADNVEVGCMVYIDNQTKERLSLDLWLVDEVSSHDISTKLLCPEDQEFLYQFAEAELDSAKEEACNTEEEAE